jgi:hypothetical protein
MKYYIASCVFTEKHPALSDKIQAYARRRGMSMVRCCVPGYKVHEFETRMHPAYRGNWQALPHCADFGPGDAVYSICHNCLNIIEETKSAVGVFSIWEAIAADPDFDFPNFHGRPAVLQDCWRARGRTAEQDAVRSILDKMHVRWTEAPKAREQTDFCGNSLYRPQPPRNPRLAPAHYARDIAGKFESHSPEEQRAIMQDYCKVFGNAKVVCYCHYCFEGLQNGGADGVHLAQWLF